jgi:hypothetical protein
LRDLKVTHQKNQPHPSLEKNELPPKKIKIKIKKCPGTRAQGCGALVPWTRVPILGFNVLEPWS